MKISWDTLWWFFPVKAEVAIPGQAGSGVHMGCCGGSFGGPSRWLTYMRGYRGQWDLGPGLSAWDRANAYDGIII